MKKGGSRKNKTKQAYSVIGLKTPSFKLKVAGGDSHNWYDMVADFTTYPDRAIIKLTHNDTGEPEIKILGGCIKGKTVSMLAGSSGYKWEFTDYASIERNGEKSVEISNDYITSSDQCKAVGDYEWKESRYHPEYVVELNGTHYEYAIGDRWTLQVDYTLNGNVLEHIDTDVIIESVSYGKSVGSLGSTKLGLRVPSSAWALTMAKNAKLTGAGKVNWKGNRSNIITVAASDYVGQADFYCDGTDDEEEIESAIALLSESGGGEVRLTNGTFTTGGISVNSSVVISGEGIGTKIIPRSTELDRDAIIQINTAALNVLLYNFNIDSTDVEVITPGVIYGLLIDPAPSGNIICDKIIISNLSSTTSQIIGIGCLSYGYIDIRNCYITTMNATAITGISGADRVESCIVESFTSSGDKYGIITSKRCSKNRVGSGMTSKYYASYADAGTANACADTASGGYNS
jgi:hypothetical protein